MAAIYGYLDESGALSDQLPYVAFALIVTRDPHRRELARIIKRVRQRILKKSVRQVPELKFHSSDKTTRIRVLNLLATKPIAIYAVVVEKGGKHIADSPDNNGQVAAALLDLVTLGPKDHLHLIVDKKYTKESDRERFNHVIREKAVMLGVPLVDIEHGDGRQYPPLQIVDFVAGAFHRKYAFRESFYTQVFQAKIKRESVKKWSELKKKKQ